MMSSLASGYRTEGRLRTGRRLDGWLLLSAVILIVFGLISLYSVGVHKDGGTFFRKQLFNIAIGVVPCAIFGLVNPRFWLRSCNWLYAINLIGLIAVLKFGSQKNGAERWIDFGPVQFQPSEMAKILVVLTLASFYAVRQDKLDKLSTFLLGLAHVLVPMVLILKQPHMGATLVVAVSWAAISLVANVPIKFVGGALATGVAFLVLAFTFSKLFPGIAHPYQLGRLSSFFGLDSKADDQKLAGDPKEKAKAEKAKADLDYQPLRARIAFGLGGLVGTGFTKGTEGDYIPEQQTDFIFTVPGEELGLVGCTLALVAFGFLFYRIWLVMLHATEPFYRMIATGILAILAFHTFINLFMVTKMAPVVGLWLPFMSYGGTAMWLCMSSVALVLNIRSREKPILF